ncbi:hypothetical protein [Flavobacterium sp.]
MKKIFLAIYRFFTGKSIAPPSKHHYDKNEGDEGIDDSISKEGEVPDSEK